MIDPLAMKEEGLDEDPSYSQNFYSTFSDSSHEDPPDLDLTK
jgi:hypothetical protein